MLRLYFLSFAYGGISEFDNPIIENEGLPEEAEDLELEEQRRYRYHKVIERNPQLSRRAKEIHGFICMVCGFNFEEKYGKLGSGYIEAHHVVPLSQLPLNKSITLSAKDDFKVVCANCHRMLHRKGGPGTFEDFVRMYQEI